MRAARAYEEGETQSSEVNRLVTENLTLVKRIVGQLPSSIRQIVPRDDLISSGVIGLVEAAHRYDPDREATFVTFAYRRVKGSIMDYLRKQDVLSKSARKRLDRIRDFIQSFREENGRKPSIDEISDELDLSEERVLDALSNDKWNYLTSLEKPIEDGEGGRTELSALVPARTDTPLEKVEHKEQVDLVSEAIKELSEQQQQVIVMYYYKELYMKEIAEVLEVSESRVSQIHTKALYDLGKNLEDK